VRDKPSFDDHEPPVAIWSVGIAMLAFLAVVIVMGHFPLAGR
jgi:hypothetical protein